MYLDIIGDGPQRHKIQRQISSRKLERFVRCHGWVSHAEVQDILNGCDFLGLPSVREFGGGVVLEAMSLGLTPIVANYGGPADLVNERCGILVPFQDERSLVEGFTRALASLVEAPEMLDKLGAAAIEEVNQKHTWHKKAEKVSQIYEEVLNGSSDLRHLSIC
jgi:glycosyltransferase involved in cell wall biosynthesis